jgi:hypothetical protein
VAGPSPNYGYRFNEGRDAYLVDEEKMAVVRRIFEMVGARGMTLNSVRRVLEDEGTPSPSGRRLWNKSFLRNLLADDTYLSWWFRIYDTSLQVPCRAYRARCRVSGVASLTRGAGPKTQRVGNSPFGCS